MTDEHKRVIEQAATLQGQTVSSFAVSTLLKAAEEAIQRARTLRLSANDFQLFIRMVDASAEPNATLKAAAGRYLKRRGR